ncbi:MAG TPA: hypothetical protein VNO21_08510 [Polyangiaceae bacterium]|nr:hypothetical protein [Polyangiaceae bacterium]
MRGARFALLTFLTAIAVCAACGLEESGFGPVSDNGDANLPDGNGGTHDTGADSPSNPCANLERATCSTPDHWHPVGYVENGNCQAGFDAEPAITNPQGGSCDCCTVDANKCPFATLEGVGWDNAAVGSANCQTQSGNIMFVTSCHVFTTRGNNPTTIAVSHFKATATVSPGTVMCSGNPTANNAGVKGTPVQLCTTSNAVCQEALCAAGCIAPDDGTAPTACPSGYDQTAPHVVGSAATAQCGTSSCTCSATCVASATLHTDNGCVSAAPAPVSLDGQCDPVNGGTAQNYGSIQYGKTISPQSCDAPPDPTGYTLTNQRLICCKQ